MKKPTHFRRPAISRRQTLPPLSGRLARRSKAIPKEVRKRVHDLEVRNLELDRQNDQLRQDEQQFRLLFELNPNAMWVFDQDSLKFLTVNQAALKLYGYSSQEFAGMTPKDIRPPEHVPRFLTMLERQKRTRAACLGVWRHCRKDGSEFDVEITQSCIQFRGRPARLAVMSDVTERRRAEMQLRRSRHEHRFLARVGQRLLGSEDPRRVIHEVCQAVMTFLDCHVFFNYLAVRGSRRLKLNAFGGISAKEARRVEWLEYGADVCGRVARTGKPIIAGDIQKSKTPRTAAVVRFGVQAYCCHPLIAQREVIGTLSFGARSRARFSPDQVALMRAVAEQVSLSLQRLFARDALFGAEERLRLALEGGLMGTWEWDPRTNRAVWDERQRELLDLPHCAGPVNADSFFKRVHPEDLPELRRVLNKALRRRARYHHEFRVILGDGATRWLAAGGQAVPGTDGHHCKITGVHYEITDRKTAEEELRTLARTLELRVVQRTAEIEAANRALRQEMQRRRQIELENLGIGEREQQRIGRELHDSLGQHLHALFYLAKLLQKGLEEKSLPHAHDAARLAALLEESIELTRGLARGLQPVKPVPEGLMVALRELAAWARRLYRADCRFQCRRPVLLANNTVATHIYRIAQEALNNSLRRLLTADSPSGKLWAAAPKWFALSRTRTAA